MQDNHSDLLAQALVPGLWEFSPTLAWPGEPLLNAIAAPIFIKDIHHRWCFVNQAYGQLVGYSPRALLGQSEADILPAAQAQACLAAERQALEQGAAHGYQGVLTHSSGQIRSIQGHITPLQTAQGQFLIGTFHDTTSRQQAEEQLRQRVEQSYGTLQTALDFEATLKRITDRVRDSLDQRQILLTAVKELTEALEAKGSNTALYDLEQGTSTIYYEYNRSLPSYQGRVAQMEAFPEVYQQLLAGQYFQFCSKEPNPVRGHVAMLACPIRDDRGVLGDLWLINAKEYGFTELEIRLVQQVSNQCAIAIRQARLYQAAQSQVEELERLNTLKDDFLSTVSHELRTPVTSMRVALQLLGVTLKQTFDLDGEVDKPKAAQSRVARYYYILQEECEREIGLINDLLDLQRIDGGSHPMHPEPLDLGSWLPGLVDGFMARTRSRQQALTLELPAVLPPLVTDLPSLERLLVELLNNACKYTPPAGHIHLSLGATRAPGGDAVCFRVLNTGVEIPAAEIPRIFDKFYRVPSADPWRQGGTGLGLALVKKLVQYLGGSISVNSGHGQTQFEVTLPCHPHSTPHHRASPMK